MDFRPKLYVIKGGAARGRGGLPSFAGTHGPVLRYDVRLRPPGHREAWLYGAMVDGVPNREFLCTVQPDRELRDVACALWHAGAHYDSELTIWFGVDPSAPSVPERSLRARIVAACRDAFEAVMADRRGGVRA